MTLKERMEEKIIDLKDIRKDGVLSDDYELIEECNMKIALLTELLNGGEVGEKILAKHQPCGCQVCVCDDIQCQGCGAKRCNTPECVLTGDYSKALYFNNTTPSQQAPSADFTFGNRFSQPDIPKVIAPSATVEEVKMESEPVYKLFGARVTQIRDVLGMTQGELGKRVGLTRTSLNNIEHGRQRVQLHTVEAIAKAFGMKPTQLIKGIWI